MLAITKNAVTAIKGLAASRELPESGGIRISARDDAELERSGSLELSLAASPAEDDTIVDEHGARGPSAARRRTSRSSARGTRRGRARSSSSCRPRRLSRRRARRRRRRRAAPRRTRGAWPPARRETRTAGAPETGAATRTRGPYVRHQGRVDRFRIGSALPGDHAPQLLDRPPPSSRRVLVSTTE